MNKPCSKCTHLPTVCCRQNCDKYKKYEKYKESRRKYRRGKQIKSIVGFFTYCENNNYIYYFDMIRHVEVIKSWQYRIIEMSIDRGNLYRAIKK